MNRFSCADPGANLRGRHVDTPGAKVTKRYLAAVRQPCRRVLSSPDHYDRSKLGDPFGVAPRAEARDHVGADEKKSFRARISVGIRRDGIHGERYTCPLRLDGIDREPRVVIDQQPDHLQSLRGRCNRAGQLQGLDGRGNEHETIEVQTLDGVDGGEQMSDVRRIEAAAHESQAHDQRAAARSPAIGGFTGAVVAGFVAAAGVGGQVRTTSASVGNFVRKAAHVSSASGV